MTPLVAVIPTRGSRLDLLEEMLHQLDEEGVHVVLVDTGMRHRPSPVPLTLLPAEGRGIHAWWNQGLAYARRTWPGSHVAVLNDDIRMASGMVADLSNILRRGEVVRVVCPSAGPDMMDPAGWAQEVTQLAVGPHKLVGLTGWAFMIRADDPYRFPEEAMWWYGDNDLLRTCQENGDLALRSLLTWAIHVDGGSQTGDWDALTEQTEKDRAWFNAKWVPIGYPPS